MFLLHSHLQLALCAGALVYRARTGGDAWAWGLLAASGTCAVYSLHSWWGLRGLDAARLARCPRLLEQRRYLRGYGIQLVAGLVVAAWAGFGGLSPDVWARLLPVAGLALGYSAGLGRWAGRSGLVAAGWGYVLAVWPLGGSLPLAEMAALWLRAAALVWPIALAFEARDTEQDAALGLRTLAVRWGAGRVVAAAVAIWIFWGIWAEAPTWIVGSGAGILAASHRWRYSVLYFVVAVDGLLWAWWTQLG